MGLSHQLHKVPQNPPGTTTALDKCMKLFFIQILFFVRNKKAKKNVLLLIKFLIFLAAIITLYSTVFHLLMMHEGRNYSWITGFYWTLTVMSTLGFGDITFSTDNPWWRKSW